MSTPFDPTRPKVVTSGLVVGPQRTSPVRFALDTGSNQTVISATILTLLGYDLSVATRHGRLRSATGGAAAPVIEVRQLDALEHTRSNFRVVAHDMPPAVTYDGLLGLDFFRGLVLTLDFSRGRVSLNPPRRWWQLWR
jgi:hypothetical protein